MKSRTRMGPAAGASFTLNRKRHFPSQENKGRNSPGPIHTGSSNSPGGSGSSAFTLAVRMPRQSSALTVKSRFQRYLPKPLSARSGGSFHAFVMHDQGNRVKNRPPRHGKSSMEWLIEVIVG